MGGNIETGAINALYSQEDVDQCGEKFHKAVDGLGLAPDKAERRHDEGPPVFRVGEVIEVRGMRFRVGQIDRCKLVLRPVKG